MVTYLLIKRTLTVLSLILLVTIPKVHAVNDTVYPLGTSASATYDLNDTLMTIDDTLVITRTFVNNTATPLSCFYFCDNLPDAFTIVSHTVTINNSIVTYDFPSPTASIYSNYTRYNFVLDYPGTHGTYDLLIQPDDTVVVAYKSICTSVGTYDLPLHTFIAHDGTNGVFGYSDSLTMRFDVSLDIDERAILPNSFSVKQNYPNPFNPSTTIEFTLPEKSYVTVGIYNTLGQSIATILHETLSAGSHVTTWNGKDEHKKTVASGVYIYKVQTKNNALSKKMLLLK